jgi:hypothetical protein
MPVPTVAEGDAVGLARGAVRAVVLPREGGVVAELVVGGASVLARTPWADGVVASASPAPDEGAWVRRWRGGWQPCFPTAGQPDSTAQPHQGFHGAASQSPWEVTSARADAVGLRWRDVAGLSATRSWTLTDDGLELSATAVNDGPDRTLCVAEHLILGSDLLAPLDRGAQLRLEAAGRLALLDYDGIPTGRTAPWPAGDWDRVTDTTPARVAALTTNPGAGVSLIGPHLTATVHWHGLAHALIWEELRQTDTPPWNGSVQALGIEPTSTPHGAGTARDTGLVLRTGDTVAWRVRLSILPTASREDTA